MDIADVDGSGTIDFEEWKEFINKLDDKQEESHIKEIFDSIDENGNGELS